MSWCPDCISGVTPGPKAQVKVRPATVQLPTSVPPYIMGTARVELNSSSEGRVTVKESPSLTCAVATFQSNLSRAKLSTYSGPACGSFAAFTLVRLTLVISIWGLTSAAAGAASPWTTIPRAARSATATPATLDLTALDNRLLIDVCMLSPFAFIRWNRDTSNAGRMQASSPDAGLRRKRTPATSRISSILQHGNV